MRTTITLDRDIEILLKKIQAERHLSFKESVNNVLRAGFSAIFSKKTCSSIYQIKPLSVGKILDESDCPTNTADRLEEIKL